MSSTSQAPRANAHNYQAGGTIGSYFTKHLLATGKHSITALTRAGGKSEFPAGVHRAEIDYDDESTLVAALKGQDVLVITLSPRLYGTELKLVRAAAEAGVTYVVPNAYGPDARNNKMIVDMFGGNPWLQVTEEVERLGVSSWIVLGVGFWYEWSLCCGGEHRFGCGIENRTMTFFDDGEEKITTSTFDQCGRGLAGLLNLKTYPEDEADQSPAVDNWANRVAYISSFRVSQRDMFESAKRVTGTTDADWKIEHVNSEQRYKAAKEKFKNGNHLGLSEQMYTRIFFPTGEGDSTRHGLANEALGLPEENIDDSTKEGLRLNELGRLAY